LKWERDLMKLDTLNLAEVDSITNEQSKDSVEWFITREQKPMTLWAEPWLIQRLV